MDTQELQTVTSRQSPHQVVQNVAIHDTTFQEEMFISFWGAPDSGPTLTGDRTPSTYTPHIVHPTLLDLAKLLRVKDHVT